MARVLLSLILVLAACNAAPRGTAAPVDVPALVPADLSVFFDCLRETGATVAAAHRGGPAPGYAENAIETFAYTVSRAPALLEIDIASTSDGVLVLMHDDTLERTTTGVGDVQAKRLVELKTLYLKDEHGAVLNARVPTLREALDWAAGKAVLELDVKRGVAYEAVIDDVRAAGAMARVVFITYSDAAAIRVHRLAPEMMLSVSIDEVADLDRLTDAGVDLSRVLAWTGIDDVDAELYRALAARGVESMFGTLGRPDSSWDGRFAREGRDRYAEFAKAGLQLISTDRTIEAARDLDTHDGVDGVAAMRCVGARPH